MENRQLRIVRKGMTERDSLLTMKHQGLDVYVFYGMYS